MKKGVSYFGNRFVEHFKQDLSEIISFPFQYLLHTFSENDLRYFRGTLQDLVGHSKQAGLEVYIDPWGVGRVFGGEAFSRFIADHPEESQILSSGRRVGAACPNRKAFQDFMAEWVEAASSLGGDVIFWDEPHFFIESSLAIKDPSRYEDWACQCTVCQEKFKAEFGHAMEKTLTPEVMQFRQKSLVDFLKTLCQQVHQKGLRNAVCLLAVPLLKFSKILGIEDWRSIACLDGVDILSTDPYWSLLNVPVEEFVGAFSQKVVKLASEFGKESEVWIQGFKIPKEKEGEVLKAIQVASSFKPSRIAVWSYRATACMSELACGDSQLVWQKVRDAFRSI